MTYGHVFSIIPIFYAMDDERFTDTTNYCMLSRDNELYRLLQIKKYPSCDGLIRCLTHESCGNSRLRKQIHVSWLTQIPM